SSYDDFLDASFDDLTVELFQKESGIELPIPRSDAQRFANRAALLRSPQWQQRFLDWRGDKVRDFYAEAVQTLRRSRTDLEIVNALAVEDREFFQYLAESGRSFQQIMREYAIDLEKLNAVDGLRTGRWT